MTPALEANGMLDSHCYGVLDVTSVQTAEGTLLWVVKTRCTWGEQGFKGSLRPG